MSEIIVNKENFEEKVIEKSKEIPILVDFWAPWCMPCRLLAPILEKLMNEFKDKFILVKINIDEYPEIASKYGIMSIPNVKLFKNGKVVDEFVGAYPEDTIRKWLNERLI